MNENKNLICPACGRDNWTWANVGLPHAVLCTDCGFVYSAPQKPWVEITKGQIDECLKHSDNYDFAWAIEHICRLNNGYPPHKNFKPEVSGSLKWSKP
jgi:hypothetical protein